MKALGRMEPVSYTHLFAPAHLSGKPEEIRKWAVDEMMAVARAAQEMGVHIVTGFTGSPIWPFWYSFPQTSQQMVDDGFGRIKELWTPIFDVFDECGVKFALEVHPTEIAFDYYSTQKLLDTFDPVSYTHLSYQHGGPRPGDAFERGHRTQAGRWSHPAPH